MLQQTQVATVIPYFERWMDSFPDVESLANAPLDDVLARWSGLGYYARARNLHRAASICQQEHDGTLPEGAENLSALPGIGLSTANAIVSQSTDRPAAILDGNVRRVLARHAAVEGWTGKSSVQKQLWREAEKRLPGSRGADYTQAVMDLGSMVCTRTKPDCGRCPVSEDCQALIQDRVDSLPAPKPVLKVSDKTLHMLVLQDARGRVLLEKRPPAGIWGGLWCLPEGDSIESIHERLGISGFAYTTLPDFQHRLSHVRMRIHPLLANSADTAQVKCSPHLGWFDRDQQRDLGLPKPVTDLLNGLYEGELN